MVVLVELVSRIVRCKSQSSFDFHTLPLAFRPDPPCPWCHPDFYLHSRSVLLLCFLVVLLHNTNTKLEEMARKLIPNYVTASIAISLGGFLNGYDTGGIGAIMQMEEFQTTIGHLSPFLLGFTVSLIMLTGAIPAVFAGHLADKLGRLKVIMAGSILFAAGAVIQGTAYSLPQFLVGRALCGFGEGVFLSIVSVYICEVAPAKNRGILAGLPQFMATAGVCIGYFTCYATVAVQSSMAWRAPYVVQSILAVGLVAICLVLPDSPRWLMSHGRRQEALQALKWLDFSMIEAERDFMTVTDQQASMSLWQGITLLFKKGYRAQTTLALFVLGMVQLSGIDGVLYVSSASFFLSLPSLTIQLVRPSSVLTGRYLLGYCLLPSFWLVCHTNVGYLHPWVLARRQMGQTHLGHRRRHRLVGSHATNRYPLRGQRGAPVRYRTVGCHCIGLRVWLDILLDVGHRWEDLRQ